MGRDNQAAMTNPDFPVGDITQADMPQIVNKRRKAMRTYSGIISIDFKWLHREAITLFALVAT